MNIASWIAIIIGVACMLGYLANILGKRKLRNETPLQAKVTDTHTEEWRSSSTDGPTSTSYIVTTTFDVPLKGALTHTRNFGSSSDATAWSARFDKDTWHPVLPHPYGPGTVFLKEEMESTPLTAIAIGCIAFIIAGLAHYFG